METTVYMPFQMSLFSYLIVLNLFAFLLNLYGGCGGIINVKKALNVLIAFIMDACLS